MLYSEYEGYSFNLDGREKCEQRVPGEFMKEELGLNFLSAGYFYSWTWGAIWRPHNCTYFILFPYTKLLVQSPHITHKTSCSFISCIIFSFRLPQSSQFILNATISKSSPKCPKRTVPWCFFKLKATMSAHNKALNRCRKYQMTKTSPSISKNSEL